MVNKVGKVESEKLSDLHVYKVFDLSDVLFDKFLLFFKLETAVSTEKKDGKGERDKLGKATAPAKKGGKAAEADESKTLAKVKECQEMKAEANCNATEQVLFWK